MEVADCAGGQEVGGADDGRGVGLVDPRCEDGEVGVFWVEDFAVVEEEVECVEDAAGVAGESYVFYGEVGEEGGDDFWGWVVSARNSSRSNYQNQWRVERVECDYT